MANPPKRIVLDVCISNAHMNSKRLRYAERLMRIAGRGVSGSDIAQNKDYQTNILFGPVFRSESWPVVPFTKP